MKRDTWNGCLHPASLRTASRLLEVAKEAERKEGEHFARLAKGFPRGNGNRQVGAKSYTAPQFANIVSAFAAAVLSAPPTFPAHLTDYAMGLLSETVDFMNAERRATP